MDRPVTDVAIETWKLVQDQLVAATGAMVGLGVVSLVVTALLLPTWIVRLPADHFSPDRVEPERPSSLPHLALRLLKNALGVVLIGLGLLMLILPGQGLLTILIGILLVELPGKRAVERRLARRPLVRAFLDRVRVRHGAPPLMLD